MATKKKIEPKDPATKAGKSGESRETGRKTNAFKLKVRKSAALKYKG
jgi:hypothetical protein